MTNHNDVYLEAAKNAPPIAVAGLTLYGVSLQDWVLLATLLYTTLSLFFLLRDKLWKPWKAKRYGRK